MNSIQNQGQCERLPNIKTLRFYEEDEGAKMEFRLTCKGRLRAERCDDRNDIEGAGRAKDKHQLRKYFHKQLKELWQSHPDLIRFRTEPVSRIPKGDGRYTIVPPMANAPAKPWVEFMADDFSRCGGRFVPLVSNLGGFTCSLEILFLRRDQPGNLVQNGGDIDNRIKVLLDGLRIPETVPQLGGILIDQNEENPFYCLLENDKWITGISIITDRLLTPLEAGEAINDVEIVIHVIVVNPSDIFTAGRYL